jgi:hypothetical protein
VTFRMMRQMQRAIRSAHYEPLIYVPFGVTYDKIGTIQRRLAWPLHKDDTLVQSGSATADNIFFSLIPLRFVVRSLHIFDFSLCYSPSAAHGLSDIGLTRCCYTVTAGWICSLTLQVVSTNCSDSALA